MNMTLDSVLAHDLRLPSTGGLNNPAAQGRNTALRVFAAAMTTMDGRDDYETAVCKVAMFGAPDEFKAAFVDTLRTLCATFQNDN